MNYLEIAKALQQESTGVTSITTTVSQAGEAKRFCDWASQAHEDIQLRHDNWRWMRKSFTFNTTAAVAEYAYGAVTDVDTAALISRFSRWITGSDILKVYLQSAGAGTSRFVPFIEWDDFRMLYRLQPVGDSAPAYWTVDPKDQIVLGPAPNDVYVVSGDYQRSPLVFAANADTPEWPPHWHRLTVWEALLKYGGYTAASEAWQRANKEASRMWLQLEANQKPKSGFGDPLC